MTKPTFQASLFLTLLLAIYFLPILIWPSLYTGIRDTAFQTIFCFEFSALLWICLNHRVNQPIAIDQSNIAQQFRSHTLSNRTTKTFYWCLAMSMAPITYMLQLPLYSSILIALSIYAAHRVASSYMLVSATANDKTALQVEVQHKEWNTNPGVAIHYKQKYNQKLFGRRYQQKQELIQIIEHLKDAPIQSVSITSHVLLNNMQKWILKQLNIENIPHTYTHKFCPITDLQICFYILVGAFTGQLPFKGLLGKLPKPWERKIFIDINIDQMRGSQK